MAVENRPEELAQVRRRAIEALHDPLGISDAIPLRRVKEQVHIWTVTTFHDARSWTVYREYSGAILVRRVLWDQMADLERMTQPLVGARFGFSTQPTLEVADAPFEAALVDGWLMSLSRISIVPIVASGVQLDGTRFGLRTLEGRFSVEWSSESEAWAPLVMLVSEIRSKLDLKFVSSG